MAPSNEEGNFFVELVGITARSGVLKQFLKLRLHYAPADESQCPAFTFHSGVPEGFMSLAFKNHMALAVPAVPQGSTAH